MSKFQFGACLMIFYVWLAAVIYTLFFCELIEFLVACIGITIAIIGIMVIGKLMALNKADGKG